MSEPRVSSASGGGRSGDAALSTEAWEAAALLARTEAASGTPLGGGAVSGGLNSPRKPAAGARSRSSVLSKSRRPKQEIVAALDPEGAERRRQMELLRQRMNELPHARLGLEPP